MLLCAGARPDIFPSGMSRGMGDGRKAYITRLGQPALRTGLVDIFDDAELDAVRTIEEQTASMNDGLKLLDSDENEI